MSRTLNEDAFANSIGAFCEAVINVMADPKSAKKTAENLAEIKQVKKDNDSALNLLAEKETALLKKISDAENAEKKALDALEKLKSKEALLKEGFDSLKLGEKDLANKLRDFDAEKTDFDKKSAKLESDVLKLTSDKEAFSKEKSELELEKKAKEEKLKAALESL